MKTNGISIYIDVYAYIHGGGLISPVKMTQGITFFEWMSFIFQRNHLLELHIWLDNAGVFWSLLYSNLCRPSKYALDITSKSVPNLCPTSHFCLFVKKKKSLGARSGEYNSTNLAVAMMEEWAGTLSWRNRIFFLARWGRFPFFLFNWSYSVA